MTPQPQQNIIDKMMQDYDCIFYPMCVKALELLYCPKKVGKSDCEDYRSRPVSSCTWKLNDEYGMYETGCGNAFECIEGDIEENNFKFCPYCGGRIKEIVEGAP